MPKITLEKMHEQLEKLTEYVMNEVPRKADVPTKKEMNERFEKMDARFEQMDRRFGGVAKELANKADKKDVERIEKKIDKLIEGMDSQAKQLDIISIVQLSTSATLDRHEQRLEA